jgi:hypothetical protein
MRRRIEEWEMRGVEGKSSDKMKREKKRTRRKKRRRMRRMGR